MSAEELAEKVNQGNDLEISITVKFKSKSGVEYKGTVIFKRPSVRDYMKISGLKSRYIQENIGGDIEIQPGIIDPAMSYFAEVMATFEVCIKKCPEWLLSPAELYDIDVLYHVYDTYQKKLALFRNEDT